MAKKKKPVDPKQTSLFSFTEKSPPKKKVIERDEKPVIIDNPKWKE